MRYLESYELYNEKFDLFSKIKSFLNNKINSYSRDIIDNIKSDLINFCEDNNIDISDLKDIDKIKSVLLVKNESRMNYSTGMIEDDEIDREEEILRSGTEEEKMQILKSRADIKYKGAKWVLDNPILAKLSKYGALLSIILSVLQFFGIKDNINFLISGVATTIVGISLLLSPGIGWSKKSAEEEVKRYLKNK